MGSVGIVTITSGGSGYTTTPSITFTGGVSGTAVTATAEAVMVGGTVRYIRLSNAGTGYTSTPTITIGAATSIGDGDYIFNEPVRFASSEGTAMVKVWDSDSRTLDVSMLTSMALQVGEKVTGETSGAEYIIQSISYNQPSDFTNSEYVADQYADNDTFETEADDLLDFTERNPFGTF